VSQLKRPPSIAGVETLLTPLPVMKMSEADDFTRLHQDELAHHRVEAAMATAPAMTPTPNGSHV
jgi:hypothetical protein